MAEESEYGPGASESSKKRSVRSGRKLIRIVIARHLLLALVLPIALHGMGCEAEVIPLAEENRADDARVAGQSAHIVYGNDDRIDVYASSDETLRAIAMSATAALVPYSLLHSTPQGMALRGGTLGGNENLCMDERFRDQPVNATCSATLVAKDLILTAGHCVPSGSSCQANAIVFNYRMADERSLARITDDDVYGCSEIIARAHSNRSGLDFAFLRLDREVAPHLRPVALRMPRGSLPENTRVAMIGHPSGLPAKIATGARVMRSSLFDGNVFLANLDAFSGNSGSGVFDETGALVGVLVFGHADYRERAGGACREVVRRNDSDGSEGIVYAYRAFDHLCERSPKISSVCETICRDRTCMADFQLRSECSPEDECETPDGWRCDPDDYGSGGACQCGCGAPDPDCLLPSRPVIGCQGDEVCSLKGECTPPSDKDRRLLSGCSAADAETALYPWFALVLVLALSGWRRRHRLRPPR